MKKFICKCMLFGAILLSLLGGIVSFILYGLPEQFNGTYQHALYLQVRSLARIRSPKIVVMGDSSVPFSLECGKMSRLMKEPVQTLGIHSGTGIQYILDLSKSSIRRGDTMVLELTPDAEDSFSPSIVLTACENHFDMYRSFTLDDWEKVIRYYPTYLTKKVKYYFHVRDSEAPSYSITSFDRNGNYDYRRVGCQLPMHLQASERDTVFNKEAYSDSMISFLNGYDRFCAEKGATFLITFPPFLDESLASKSNSLNDVQSYLAKRLKAPIITKISSRDLPRRYFYNNETHCNTIGAEKVTQDLAEEILAYRRHFGFGKGKLGRNRNASQPSFKNQTSGLLSLGRASQQLGTKMKQGGKPVGELKRHPAANALPKNRQNAGTGLSHKSAPRL